MLPSICKIAAIYYSEKHSARLLHAFYGNIATSEHGVRPGKGTYRDIGF
jgi:hypothetical protein